MKNHLTVFRSALFVCAAAALISFGTATSAAGGTAGQAPTAAPDARAVLDRYCVTCHNQRLKTGGLALDTLDLSAL